MNTPGDILKKYWGFETFRPLQYEIIQAVVGGRDTLALLPTGGGKSICFQVPAMLKPGLTLVISPLIALMNDQVDQLKTRGIKAAGIHSGMHKREIDQVLSKAMFGDLKLLYLAPERLFSPWFLPALQRLPISQIVVDEAHCISLWGYDFRPSYLKIKEIRAFFPKAPIVALTATATSSVLEDIQDKLSMRDTVVFRAGFLRPNLKFGVLRPEDKRQYLFSLVKKLKASSIIYVRSRRQSKFLSEFLALRGLSVTYYHAGLDKEIRKSREISFLKGEFQHMVATNAFGMGIDKSEVRMVLHYDLPENLESYYQEAGRAGRDGKDSYAVILFQERDLTKLEQNFDQEFPGLEEIKRVYRALTNHLQIPSGSGEGRSFAFDFFEFVGQYNLPARESWNIIKIMEQDGWISLNELGDQISKVQFLTERQVIYDYQLRHKNKDSIIQILLRLHQGILTELVPVKEKTISDIMKISEKEIQIYLQELQKDGIIEYIPKNQSGQIIFLRERVPADHFSIDQELYNFRKKRRRFSLDRFKEYLITDECRQKFILKYFDEDLMIECGVCDICKSRGKKGLSRSQFRIARDQILEILVKSTITPTDLLRQFPQEIRDQIMLVIQYLLNEERIIKQNGFLSAKDLTHEKNNLVSYE